MAKIVKTHRTFDKHYEKRILTHSQLDAKFQERLKLFISDPKNAVLNDHPLSGKKKEFRSFSITGNIRVVYQEEYPDEVTFLDIGTHNQVY